VTERTPSSWRPELRKLGITLRQLPGEFSVNFRDGSDATTRNGETLDEALATSARQWPQRSRQRPAHRAAGDRADLCA